MAKLDWIKAAGSEQFLEPKSLALLLAPAAVLTSVVASADSNARSVLAWTLANLLAFSLILPILLAFRKARQRFIKGETIGLIPVALISFSLGALKSFMTGVSASFILNMQEPFVLLSSRTLGGGLAGLVAIPMVAAFANLLEEVRKDRDQIIARRVERDLKARTLSGESESVASLIAEIELLRARVTKGQGALNQLSPEISLLTELAQNKVRPLSHSLFESLERSYPKVTWRHLLARASESGAPATFVALLNLVTLPRNIEVVGLQQGISHSLSTSFLIYISITVLNRFVQFRGDSAIAAAAAAVSLSTLASYGLALTWLPPLGPNFMFLAIALIVWLTQSALVYSVLKSLFETKSATELELGSLEGSIASPSATEIELQRSELGLLLHGQVQSRIMSLALRTKFGEEMQREVVLAELDLILELISKKAVKVGEVETRFEQLVMRWWGFLEFDFDLESAGSLLDKRVIDLVEEATSNAYRHGLAKRVKLMLVREDNRVVLELQDDGLGPRGGNPGLGSRLLTELCDYWELTSSPEGGARLYARLKS